MKHILISAAVIILLFTGNLCIAQGIAINNDGTSADNSAMLDVKSTSKGMLAPRMTAAQRTAIVGPATGLLVYQTDDIAGFYYYDGTTWRPVDAQWTLTGNDLYNYNTGMVHIGLDDLAYLPGFKLQVFDTVSSTVTNALSGGIAGFGYGKVGTGVYGRGTYSGIYGEGLYDTSYGVVGYSHASDAIAGFTTDGTAGYFSSNGSGNALITGRGNVGIGTRAPGSKLEVDDTLDYYSTNDPAQAINLYNYNAGTATASGGLSIHVDGVGSGQYGIYTHVANGDGALIHGTHYGVAGYGNGYGAIGGYFNSGNGYALITDTGKVGIGTNAPLEQLDVNGGIRVGNTSNSNIGAIRFDGTNFQGYNGTLWTNFGVGSGTASQWTTSGSNIFYNSGNVGIGSNSPTSRLFIFSNVATGLEVHDTLINGIGISGSATGQSGRAIYGEADSVFSIGVEGYSHSGVAIEGAAVTGTGGYFYADSGNALITGHGNVGIGSGSPLERLDVNGAIRLGNTINTNSGTIRFDGTNFQGYNGTNWANFGGTSQWTTRGVDIYNSNSGGVGIGTTPDIATLQVYTYTKARGLEVDNHATGSAIIGNDPRQGSTGVYGAADSIFSWGVLGTSDNGTGVEGRSVTGTAGHFSSSSGYALITGAGNVGIGTNTPVQALDINGGIRIGNTAASNTGAIRFDGTNFQGYNGTSWTNFGGSSVSQWTTSGLDISNNNSGNVIFNGKAQYQNNIAGSYDARSLVDKNYVDSSVSHASGGGSSPWTTTGNNIYNSNTGKVSIGTTSTTTARVLIQDNSLGAFNDVLDVKTYDNYSYAIKGEDLTTSSSYGGVYGTTNVGVGVKGESNGNGYGVYASSATGTGVYGFANNSSGITAAGGFFECSGASGTYALLTGIGNVGMGTRFPSEKLEVCGNVKVNGNISASGTVLGSQAITCSSDIRFKKDVKEIDSALIKVMQLRGVTYNWKKEEFPKKGFNDRKQIGVIAQEVEKIFPELVYTDDEGYKSVDYSRLTPILLEALKAQQQKITGLKNEQEQMKAELIEKNTATNKRLDELEKMIQNGNMTVK